MDTTIAISDATAFTAGILLLTLVTIELGGTYLLKIVRGDAPVTPFQLAFARAGHAHAGVLVILALVCQLYVDAAGLNGVAGFLARDGVALAAITMSAGFFFSSAGRERTKPNRWIALVWIGAASLAAGVVALGIGLLTST